MQKDIQDRPIDVGDIVVYTASGAGRNLPPLKFGEVVALTKAGVTVIELNKDFSRKQVEDYYMRGTGIVYGNGYEQKERVVTGQKDATPVNIRSYGDRFYIVRKI